MSNNKLPVWVIKYDTIWGPKGNYELKFAAPTDARILATTGRYEPDTKILDQKVENLVAQHDAFAISWVTEKIA
mgnify:CR=1 FL=1